MHFYARAITASPSECPLRHTTISAHEVTSISPVRIRKRRPDLCKSGAHSFSAFGACPPDFWSSGRLENTIIGHERHKGVDVMAIPSVGKRLKPFSRDFDKNLRHQRFLLLPL